ncbi:hypothetical protein LIER_05275 [Lithospermum erythrorhizon]|uniref:Uncharacterized protein n=1 Tax=Lithospermum erythrorhizon TaxID=34254 RepID=A0AAV3P156_LITER
MPSTQHKSHGICRENLIRDSKCSMASGTITDSSKVQAIGLILEIDKMQEANDVYWAQRAKAEWQLKGDRNTTFFHALSATKGKINLITTLMDWQ